jgi:hypothetical protein
MNQMQIIHNDEIFDLITIAVLITFVVGFAANIYGRYLRSSRGKAMLLLLAAEISSGGLGFLRIHQIWIWPMNSVPGGYMVPAVPFVVGVQIAFAFLLPLVALPFLAKLYLTWIAGAATDAEKAPGMEGIRAWLRGGNLVCAVLISLCLWLGFGYSFFAPLALALLALLAFPILNMAATSAPPVAPAPEAIAPERERVLKMLDDGKITAQESAELLNALAHSAPARAPQSAPAPHRRIVWIGAALLLVGFFFPWLVINTQTAMNNMMRQMPLTQGVPNFGGGMTVYVAGGDIPHGLGWCVLLFGIVAAALPFVAANLDSQTCQKACLIALGAGAIILVYLLTQNFRFVSIGLVLGLAGYVLEFVGVLQARKLDWLGAL